MVPDTRDRDCIDEVTLARTFQENEPRLRKMILFRLDPRLAARVDPDDVLQDAYLQAASRLSEFTADRSVPLFTWIRFLVSQQIAGIHRWHSRGKRNARLDVSERRYGSTASDSLLNHIVGRDSTPSQVASRNELLLTMHQLVDSLDSIDGEILSLRHFEELSNTEAAAELAISTAAASKRYVRALERLRQLAVLHDVQE